MMNKKTMGLARIALMAAVICVLSPFSIPIGTIPITLALFAIMLCAIILPPLSALCAVAIYILLGMVGLPVFSSGAGGISVLVGPTGGYIFGYLPMTLVISLCFIPIRSYVSKPAIKYVCYLAVCIFSIFLCYACGTLQFVLLTKMPLKKALALCVLPFIPFDLIKALFALVLGQKVYNAVYTHPKTT